ncbi:MAG TPA: sugar phosphate nucleotidyltransferase [Gemmatimonadaceae bacterium]|nr:sugar phosphate nucleotidyltransferase [Gemmatimonadaceae bacterium]
MKVVLFCGGLGMRIRTQAENVPKPLVPLGYRPIIWHLMKYYAHFGHTDFILCLGYRGDLIKHYFLNYEEYVTNDFVLTDGGRRRQLLSSDIDEWRITFIDTGLNSTVGERLLAVREHLDGEPMFLANYSDGLTDLPLPDQVRAFEASQATACFLAVRPSLSYHFLTADDQGLVTSFRDIEHSGLRVNGGYFVFRPEIFDYLRKGEDLVQEPFARLLDARKLLAYSYDGFWQPMDTAKDRQRFDDLMGAGQPPWFVWSPARG